MPDKLKQLQLDLQENEERFRSISSNFPGVMFQFMLEDQKKISFTYVSDGSLMLFGLYPEILMDKPGLFSEMVIPQDKLPYSESITTSANNLSLWNWKGRIQVDKDTEVKWVSLRATPKKISNNAILWDGIVIDVTRNKLAEIEIASSREQLAELSSYLQIIKEQERARIAREIDDDIGDILTAIKSELLSWDEDVTNKPASYIRKTESIESLVNQVIDSTRRISMDLRPEILDYGIVAAIKWQAKEFCEREKIRYRVSCDSDEIPLDSDLSVAIFRIFQETLTNISKHANASRLQIRLSEKDRWIYLEVTDNGCGISDQDIKKPKSFGIRGMRERCQQLRGYLLITAKSEKWTKISISIPVNAMEISSKDLTD
jgi:two-component system sensor histidine kinase UhpB